jgi:hypothetical protein
VREARQPNQEDLFPKKDKSVASGPLWKFSA